MVQKKKKTSSKSTPVQSEKTKSAPVVKSAKCSYCSWRHPFVGAAIIGILIVFIFISIDFLPRLYNQFKPAPKAPENPVVATINGTDIRLSEVREFAESMPQLAGVPFEVIYPRLLDSMVNMRVIINAAEKSGIENQENVQQALNSAREQILSQAYMADQLDKLMTEEKLREIYIQEIHNYPKQDEIKARHILVKTKAEAEKIQQQLKNGADFEKLVASDSLAKENGGDLGYFTKNMMIPEFADVVFKMKKGDISDPIKTPMGWHIVQVQDKRLATPPSFETVREELQQIFAAQNLQNILAQERQTQNVKILKPAL